MDTRSNQLFHNVHHTQYYKSIPTSSNCAPTNMSSDSPSSGSDIYRVGSSSFEIFMHFVKCEGGVCDASGIIGRECYETWLQTRKKESGKPEDIFRRTVVAHVTGTKNRRSLPVEVEASILIELRRGKVWPCFEGMGDSKTGKPVLIGKNGFKALGSHERSTALNISKQGLQLETKKNVELGFELNRGIERSWKLGKRNLEVEERASFEDLFHVLWANDDASSVGSGESRHSDSAGRSKREKKLLKRMQTIEEIQSLIGRYGEDDDTKILHDQNVSQWQNDPETLVCLFQLFGVSLVNGEDFSSSFDETNIEHAIQDIFDDKIVAKTHRSSIVKALCHFTSPETVRNMIGHHEGGHWGHGGVPVGLAKLLSGVDSSVLRDPRLQRKFILPNLSSEDVFDPEHIVGYNVLDSRTNRYTFSDENSRQLLGADVVGIRTQNIQSSSLAFWLCFRYIAPYLFVFKEVIFQTVANKADGSHYIVRCFWKLVGDDIQCYFQDISHIYPDLLLLMPLEL